MLPASEERSVRLFTGVQLPVCARLNATFRVYSVLSQFRELSDQSCCLAQYLTPVHLSDLVVFCLLVDERN
jgi:hypothetical protein